MEDSLPFAAQLLACEAGFAFACRIDKPPGIGTRLHSAVIAFANRIDIPPGIGTRLHFAVIDDDSGYDYDWRGGSDCSAPCA